ncbi:hypothetical protein CQ14_33550 [Bradyrhizobium lablabi]|uniref:Uncharacterized protein n=1 Tax=Bradyrhizobium lablabi TaxID=722472 RepID=A0A0R3MU19_9BRAD|nr:hypothetical protein [Bradyrhizobium lablabi]KRR23180.1 hypothetical protein CQ14_33550 [Bradyrhizobium lablabi]
MTNVVQVYDYRFSNPEYEIMRFRVRISEIAKSLGFEVESWDDQLGPAQGMCLRLPTGRVVVFLELQHSITYHGEKGPYVQVDAALLAEFGVEPLIDEVLTGLGLSDQLVDWRATSEQKQHAIDAMKWAAPHKKGKGMT